MCCRHRESRGAIVSAQDGPQSVVNIRNAERRRCGSSLEGTASTGTGASNRELRELGLEIQLAQYQQL